MSSSPTSPSQIPAKPILEASKAGSDEIIQKARQKQSHEIVYAIVENQRGVLHRVSTMFRSKGFNIMSIAIGRTTSPDLARMTIVPSGDEVSLALLVKQLRKMIDVIEVGTISRKNSITRELALVKFGTCNYEAKREILDLSNTLGGKALDSTHDSLVVEFCSTPESIDSFIEEASKYGSVKEVARTGIAAIQRD